MIVLEHDQGSVEWIQARLGIPTASEFHRIITPTGKLSASRDGYMAELLAEWALGEPVTEFGGNDWTERGKALEPDARACYAFQADCEPQTVGFVLRNDDRMCGASPDALVDETRAIRAEVPDGRKTPALPGAGGATAHVRGPGTGPDMDHGEGVVRFHVVLSGLAGRLLSASRRMIDFRTRSLQIHAGIYRGNSHRAGAAALAGRRSRGGSGGRSGEGRRRR